MGEEKFDIATVRAEKGLTQAQLAEMLDVDRKYISMIETGKKPLSNKLRKKLDKILADLQVPERATSFENDVICRLASVETLLVELLAEIKRR